ncbi:MAG: CcmD family protein [Planctomycetota bacterium]|nr:CcmD family protein [Planctomycetota bacterium]
MTAAAVAYLVACLGIGLYVSWVWTRQRRLSRRLRELHAYLEPEPTQEEVRSKAA